MDVKAYFDEVRAKLASMTGEEFMNILEESGLDKCPFLDEYDDIYELQITSEKLNKSIYKARRPDNDFKSVFTDKESEKCIFGSEYACAS